MTRPHYPQKLLRWRRSIRQIDSLGHARDKAIASVRQTYLATIALAEQKAGAQLKQDELKAVRDEKDAVSSGRSLGAKAPLFLPHGLLFQRAYLLKETARAEHEYAVHAQTAAADYLKQLAFFENKARAAKDESLLQQIETEKQKLTGESPASSPSLRSGSRNLVVNGDFAQKDTEGKAEGWKLTGRSEGSVLTDHDVTYLHYINPDGRTCVFWQTVDCPPEAKEVVVTVRMRSSDLNGKGEYGVLLWQNDAAGKPLARDMPIRANIPITGWKTYSGTVKLAPNAKTIQFRGIIGAGLTGGVDYSDLRGEAR